MVSPCCYRKPFLLILYYLLHIFLPQGPSCGSYLFLLFSRHAFHQWFFLYFYWGLLWGNPTCTLYFETFFLEKNILIICVHHFKPISKATCKPDGTVHFASHNYQVRVPVLPTHFRYFLDLLKSQSELLIHNIIQYKKGDGILDHLYHWKSGMVGFC